MKNLDPTRNPVVPYSLTVAQTQSLIWEMLCPQTEFMKGTPVPLIGELPEDVSPALFDVYLAEVQLLGHRDDYPRPYDWENLIPTLEGGEELLWIVSKQKNSYHFYVGLKFNQNVIASRKAILKRNQRFQFLRDNFIRRAFPESQVVNQTPTQVGNCLKQFCEKSKMYCVAGMPSYKTPAAEKVVADRDEKARPYASINDILEPHLHSQDDFCIVFSVTKASGEDIAGRFKSKFELRDKIKPLIERDINHTEGTASGEAISINITDPTTTTSETEGWAEQKSIVSKLAQLVFGNQSPGADVSGTADEIKSALERLGKIGKMASFGLPMRGVGGLLGLVVPNKVKDAFTADNIANFGAGLRKSAKNFSRTVQRTNGQRSTNTTTHQDVNKSDGVSFKVARSDLAFLDKHLEVALDHLQQVPGTGGYYAVGMVYADDATVGESVARHLKATLSGSQSFLRPMQVFNLSEHRRGALVNIPIASLLNSYGIEQEVLNSEKACLSLPLPDSELPDLKMKKSVFYGRPKEMTAHGCDVGAIAYFANNQAGIYESGRQFKIAPGDVCSHIFVCGTTGSGKTERAAHIINSMPLDVRVLVLETAKKTYRDKIGRAGRKKLVYTLGNSSEMPFRINPFYFELGTNLKQHIAVLSDAIADLLPMEALIGPKLREAVENCYKRCNWNIESSTRLSPNCPVAYPDMVMFVQEVNKICDTLSDYGNEVRSNYRGSLLNRAMIFIDDVYQDIFAYDGNKPINEILPPDTDVVIEMEDMPPSEINMPAFIISLLMQRLRAYRFKKGAKEGEKFLIVVEEAHNVLSKKLEGNGDERQSGKGGHLLKQVERLLAEGRSIGLGVMVVDQSVNAIAPSVVANTNTKIILGQKDGAEVETLGKALGLNEENWGDLLKLNRGECIVQSKDTSVPVKLSELSDEDMVPARVELGNAHVELVAPYAYCENQLNHLLGRGLFSAKRCEAVLEKMLEACNGRMDLLRFVIGKFLLSRSDYALVDCLLRGTTTIDVCRRILQLAIVNTRDEHMAACELLSTMAFYRGSLPSPDSIKVMKHLRADDVARGASYVLSIVNDDVPDMTDKQKAEIAKFVSKVVHLKPCSSSADARDQKAVVKMADAIMSNPRIVKAFQGVLAHTRRAEIIENLNRAYFEKEDE